jgi:hypothetical protein
MEERGDFSIQQVTELGVLTLSEQGEKVVITQGE